MRCLPAAEDTGIIFKRTDLPGCPAVKAAVPNVVSTKRRTSIGDRDGGVVIHAVEHLLAAFSMAGIDNVVVELNGSEVPAGDGSALVFTELIEKNGSLRQSKAAYVKKIDEPFFVRDNGAILAALPFDGFRVSYTLSYDHPFIGTQYVDYTFNKTASFIDIAAARTFGFIEEVESLRKQGLALGGSLNNAVIVTRDGTANPLRFKDEFARHKILDMTGDLALAGRVAGHFIGIKSGHNLNAALAELIRERCVLLEK